jgi:hypothetical protein
LGKPVPTATLNPLRTLSFSLATLATLLLTPASPAQTPGLEAGPWQLLGPFDNPGGNTPSVHEVQDFIEDMEVGKAWKALEEDFDGKSGPVAWKEVAGVDPRGSEPMDAGGFQFNTLFGQSASANQAAYLYCPLTAAQAMEVPILFGSDDGCAVWLNGKRLLNRPVARGLNPFEEQLTLPLEEGLNHLLVQVVSANGAWQFEMQAPRGVEQLAINRAVDRGVAYLLGRQLIDGSWEEVQFKYRNGGTALVIYTLLSSGVDPRHPAIQRGLAYLEGAPSSMTYSAGCELMALAALDDPAYLPRIEECADDLISWQMNNGGWAYPEGHWDMSTTQFAALGLRAAAEAGAEIPDKVWTAMIDLCLDMQARPDRKRLPMRAGFAYYPGYAAPTGSMTSAGVTVLAIAREQLGERLKRTEAPRVEQALQLSIQFLKEDFTTAVNPHYALNWRYYWLFGVERVAAFLGNDVLGARDWYREGSSFLVADQKADGGWSTPWGRPEATTCFALLFLKKATKQAVVTGATVSRSHQYESLPEEGPGVLLVNARPPATMWVAPKDGVEPVAVRYSARRPGAAAWQEIGMGEGTRLAMQHEFPGPGIWEVRAELFRAGDPPAVEAGAEAASAGRALAQEPAPADPPPPVSLGHTGTVQCDYQVGIRAEDLQYATDFSRNLLPSARPEVLISSQTGGNGGAALYDGKPWSSWRSAANDAQPTITIKCKRRPRARRLLLTHVRTRQSEQVSNPRPTHVEVWLNKEKSPLVVTLDPDATRKTVVEFPERVKVSQVRIVVTGVTGGQLGALAVGFSEIELQD